MLPLSLKPVLALVTVKPCFMNTCLIWTPIITDTFLGPAPYILLKTNPLNKGTVKRTLSGPNGVGNSGVELYIIWVDLC